MVPLTFLPPLARFLSFCVVSQHLSTYRAVMRMSCDKGFAATKMCRLPQKKQGQHALHLYVSDLLAPADVSLSISLWVTLGQIRHKGIQKRQTSVSV